MNIFLELCDTGVLTPYLDVDDMIMLYFTCKFFPLLFSRNIPQLARVWGVVDFPLSFPAFIRHSDLQLGRYRSRWVENYLYQVVVSCCESQDEETVRGCILFGCHRVLKHMNEKGSWLSTVMYDDSYRNTTDHGGHVYFRVAWMIKVAHPYDVIVSLWYRENSYILNIPGYGVLCDEAVKIAIQLGDDKVLENLCHTRSSVSENIFLLLVEHEKEEVIKIVIKNERVTSDICFKGIQVATKSKKYVLALTIAGT